METVFTAHRRRCGEAGSGSVQLAVVAIAVFLLIGLGLQAGVNAVAARTASAAAQRGLQVAQTPGGTAREAEQVVARMANSTGFVTASAVQIRTAPGTASDTASDTGSVVVDVELRTVLGNSVSRTASGPRLRFVPQGR